MPSDINHFKHFTHNTMIRILFIKQLIQGDLQTVQWWLFAYAIMGIVIILASTIDLRYGRLASKTLGVFRTTSYGLRKTVRKLKDYLTFLAFAAMIDGCASFFFDAPFCAALITIGVVFIEGLSVREKISAINKGNHDNDHDPILVAKAFANAYGISDFEKLEQVIKEIRPKHE